MVERRRHEGELDTEVSVAAEERIRQDERRKVLAEMAGDGRGRRALADEPTTPVTDPSATPAPSDPRRWDVPDDRWEQADEPAAVRTDRIAHVPPAEVDEVHEVRDVHDSAVVGEETVTERGFSPGQPLIAAAGAAALALGIVAVSRTGLEAPLSEPVEPVLGWDHTALLGLIEIGAGALLLLASLRAGARWLGGLIGLAAIAGGVLILGELEWTVDELGTERDVGWVAIGIGAVALLGALIPRIRRHRRVTTAHPVPA